MKTRRRGLTLVDVLLAISLLGVFAVLAYGLIGVNFSITTSTLMADGNTARLDHAIGMLRRDVSDSTHLQMPSPGTLRIVGPGNQMVEWQTDHNSLSRKSSNDKRAWNVGRPINLKLDGTIVLVADQIALAANPVETSR